MELTKLFNGTTESDLKSGHRISIDWEQLTDAIEKAVMLRPDEIIKGFVVNEKGITVNIGRKQGRKVSTE